MDRNENNPRMRAELATRDRALRLVDTDAH